MKKVLIIAYSFPPANNIGAQRPYQIAKYLPRNGWEPVILTIKREGGCLTELKVIETNYKDIISSVKSTLGYKSDKTIHEQMGITVTKDFRYKGLKSKLIKLAGEVINFPDRQRGWYKYAIHACSEYLSREKIDVILSTSYPVTSHLIAKNLKLNYRIPWIADFRDLWSQNPYSNKFGITKFLARRLELKTMKDANAIVTVTEPWIDDFKSLHKNKEVYCITNGFDLDNFPKNNVNLTKKFTITYTGQLYNGKRDPALLFEVLKELIDETIINKNSVEVRFYGPIESWLSEEIEKYGLTDTVVCFGQVSRDIALSKQMESQVLLLLLWNNKHEEGFCPGKVYEYFGAKRPILAVGWHKSYVRKLLDRTNTGRFAWNKVMLKKSIANYYSEFTAIGKVSYCGNSNIEDYTYNNIAKRYAELLNKFININK